MFFNEAVEVVLQLKKYFKRYWREKLLSNCCTRVNTARESEWTWKSQTTKHGLLSQKYPPQTKPTHTHLVLWICLSLCYKICFDIRSNIFSLQLCKALSSFCFYSKTWASESQLISGFVMRILMGRPICNNPPFPLP